MALIPWRPFIDLERFFEDDDWFNFHRPALPAMDVYETDKEVVAEVSLPGFDPKDIDIAVENGALRISGKMEEKQEDKNKEKGYWMKEIRKGSFERIIPLPAQVKENKIEAHYEKGLLKIVMPKAEEKPALKKIKIKVKK